MKAGEAESRRAGETLPAHTTLPAIFGVALATGFSGAVVPGSLLAVVVRESVRVGWAAGPVMMIGHGLLEFVAILLLITGLIAFARSPRARGIIGIVGGAVLLYLGYQTFLIGGETGAAALRAAGAAGPGGLGLGRLIWLGALMSMANPYWWLWWATIGAAHTGWAVQRGRLGGGVYFTGHILSDVLWYSAVSVAIGAGRSLLSGSILRAIYLACAVFLMAMGVIFLTAGVRTLGAGGHGHTRPAGDGRPAAER
jgi:threonine/homoserine/homoserine lactone efflux protein